jgi:glycosyltransferase 2 family protein
VKFADLTLLLYFSKNLSVANPHLMKSKLANWSKVILFLAITVGLLLLAFRGISVKTIAREILHANIFWVLLSLVPSLMALVSRSYRWILLIEPLEYHPRLTKTFYAVTIGYFANLAFPRLGEVTRCAALSKSESVPFNMLLGTVIVERIVDVITLIICLILTAIIEVNRLGTFLAGTIINPVVEKIRQMFSSPVVLAGLAIVIIAVAFVIRYLRMKSKKEKRESRIVHLIKGLVSGLKSIGQLKRPWLFVFHSILIWLLYFLSVYLCFSALPATRGLGLTAALFLLVAGGLGMSAPVQGGIGAYHLLVSQGLMLYGLSRQDGLAFATLVHTSQILMIILLGSVSLFFLFVKRRTIQT